MATVPLGQDVALFMRTTFGKPSERQALEDKLRIDIDPAFFENEQDFRPFNQVMEILSVSLEQDNDSEECPDFEHLADNPLHRNIQRQLEVCSDIVERITVEHHGSLNGSVQAMGGVARHYNQTRANVGNLRDQLRECKQLLQTGSSQTDVQELWQRKLQYSMVLRLLSALDMIKDAPVKFERLVRQKKFVGAVDLLNESLLNIFSPELVDVPAVSSVRDEMLVQKGRILDILVEEIADVVFLRASSASSAPSAASAPSAHELNAAGRTRVTVRGSGTGGGINKSGRRTRERAPGSELGDDSPRHALHRGQNSNSGTNGGAGPPSDVASESSAGDQAGVMWAGLRVDITDVADDEEQALDDPSQEFGVYLRLLVEAVRRLRYLDDVERYLLERLSDEVLTLSATHMRMCVGKAEDDGVRRVAAVDGASNSEGLGLTSNAQNLTQYLSLVFDSFTHVLANLMRLVRLLHAARLRDLRETDPGGAPVFDGDAPYKESLVLSLWQHIQAHLTDILARHVTDSQRSDRAADVRKADGGGMRKINSFRFGLGSSDKSAGDPPSASTPASASYFRPLRRPESSAMGLMSTAVELDHASAAEFCRSRLLADPSPLMIIAIFRPTLKFVEVEEAMINAMKKEVVESGHMQRDRVARRGKEGTDGGSMSLSAFMHTTARDKFLPMLGADCHAVNLKLARDFDSFFPASMASGSQTSTKRSSTESSSWESYWVASRESHRVASGSSGALRPSRGTDDVYYQARALFAAMVHMPHYAEEIGDILRTSLEEHLKLVQNRFQEITVNSASRSRLERFSDKLRELLRRDAHYVAYKAHIYGGQLRWDGGEANDIIPPKVPSRGRGRDGHPQSSAEEEADDVFESEFMMLKDMWSFDSVPFRLTKQSLLSLRNQQGVACLAYSCDWLAQKVLKMCSAIKHQSSSGLSEPSGSPSKTVDYEGRASGSSGGMITTVQKLLQMAKKLSQLADDSVLCLRLEVYTLVSVYLQQFPSIDLDIASGQGSTTAMSLGSVEDQCIVTLNRCIREEREALSPLEPKASLPLLCPKELLVFVLAPLPRLLPRLFVRSFKFLKATTITVGGVGKLNKILSTLEQTVGEVTEHTQAGQEEAMIADGSTTGKVPVPSGTVGERFGWARQYVSLVSMTQAELETFIRSNRTKYSKEEYRVVWSLVGPNRRISDGGARQKFEMWWASEKF